jgi:hypothetical protein
VYASILTCPKQYAWSLPRVTQKVRLAKLPSLQASKMREKNAFRFSIRAAALEFVLLVKGFRGKTNKSFLVVDVKNEREFSELPRGRMKN